MSNLNDFLNAVGATNQDTTKQATEAITEIGSTLGVLADLSGAIGFGTLAASTLQSLMGQDDQIELHAEIRAENILQQMRDLANVINDAETVFAQLPAMVSSKPSHDFCLTQIQTCLRAVIALTDADDTGRRWKSVYADQIYYTGDNWSPPLAPQPDAEGLVFNYRYILPLYLRSIYTQINDRQLNELTDEPKEAGEPEHQAAHR